MAKVCPECNQTFSDDEQYCLYDGLFLNYQEGEVPVDSALDETTKPRIDWKDINTMAVFPSEIKISPPFIEETQIVNKDDKNEGVLNTAYSKNENFGDAEIFCHGNQENSFEYNSKQIPQSLIPTIQLEDSLIPDKKLAKLSVSRNFEFSYNVSRIERGTVVFAQFIVERELAIGGFGHIYLVKDEKDFLKNIIVMKIIPLEKLSFMNPTKSTYKEWRVVSEYYPDKVVRLLNVRNDLLINDKQFFCLFMEYMEGGSLEELITEWMIESNQLSPSQINQLLIYFKQICESVYVLHKEQLLHRDIKPANVLFNKKKDRCKLCDFEIMHNLQSELENDGSKIIGTPNFMAPETFSGQYTVASDIFALGVTFYYCLSGKKIFDKSHISEQIFSVLNEAPKSLLEFNLLIPPELDQLILRCLEKNPDDRPANVKEILSDLNRIGNFEEEEIKHSPLSSSAPLILSKYLIQILPKDDLTFLVKRLKKSGYRSKRDAEHEESDLIEEYCYSIEPDKILQENLTTRQLIKLADILEIDSDENNTREEIIQNILLEIGFLRGRREVPGLGITRMYLDNAFNNFVNVSTSDECKGMIISACSAMEIAIDLLVRFYGQVFHGSSYGTILSRYADNKPRTKWTFGQKIKVLRQLYNSDISKLPDKTQSVFKSKFFDKKVFDLLERLSKIRNSLNHAERLQGFNEIYKSGQEFFNNALETIQLITESKNIPRAVQIISIEHDVFGRHFYYGVDDKGRKEKIFHSLSLRLGEIYLFFPLTNPARIDPLIVPYEL